jgi:hypothetical protein
MALIFTSMFGYWLDYMSLVWIYVTYNWSYVTYNWIYVAYNWIYVTYNWISFLFSCKMSKVWAATNVLSSLQS